MNWLALTVGLAILGACAGSTPPIQGARLNAAVIDDTVTFTTSSGPNRRVGCETAWELMTPSQREAQTQRAFRSSCLVAQWVLECTDGFVHVVLGTESFCVDHGDVKQYLIWVDG
jgi:hypothetical protein